MSKVQLFIKNYLYVLFVNIWFIYVFNNEFREKISLIEYRNNFINVVFVEKEFILLKYYNIEFYS